MQNPTVAVIGLGYVGLPLAVALARHVEVLGFDINRDRVEELKQAHDRTGELSAGELQDSQLVYLADESFLDEADVFIVTVPTPVDGDNKPDLGAIKAASETVGRHIKMGSVIVYESTVYPGVTEDICGPILERASGLIRGQDFFLGYSPERINPGDKVHRVDKIAKVVAGETDTVANLLAKLYGTMNGGNIFIAKDIKTAEASKVIENAQRDINIAFVNEIAAIFAKMGISVYDVLEASGTKWNFLPFTPGLVGGHCIGVDPYYLAHAAEKVGMEPRVILAGRHTNDAMADAIAERIDQALTGPSRLLMLGLAFKEDVPDIRNTKIVDLIAGLEKRGHTVDTLDPLADKAEAREHYGLTLIETPGEGYDGVVGAVRHAAFEDLSLTRMVKDGGTIFDVKGLWRTRAVPRNLRYWTL